MGHESDWGHAAERLGNHVLQGCPRWMIMVEGVGYFPGAPGMDSGGAGIWWGENLAGARSQPVQLNMPGRLVYSPHTYGPSVYMQHYFSDAAFPSNMPKLWEKRFAFLAQSNTAPVVIGESVHSQSGCMRASLVLSCGHIYADPRKNPRKDILI